MKNTIKWWVIIYHPPRIKVDYNNENFIYCDSFNWNQDPYIWNKEFLYSFCHITQIRQEFKQKDYIYFFVNSLNLKNILDDKELYLDTVFYVDEAKEWEIVNKIYRKSEVIPKYNIENTFSEHFSWVNKWQHIFKKRKHRYTLYWCPNKSFLISKNKEMLNIYDDIRELILNENWENRFLAWNWSKPFYIDAETTNKLYSKFQSLEWKNWIKFLRWNELMKYNEKLLKWYEFKNWVCYLKSN